MAGELAASVWRSERSRLVGAAAKLLRDLDEAEDCAQDALIAAMEHWPRDGQPANPAAWLMTASPPPEAPPRMASSRRFSSCLRSSMRPSSFFSICSRPDVRPDMGTLSREATCSRARSRSARNWKARGPVMASMRRTPAATPLSDTMRMSPISAVLRTCVPPHSSTESEGISTTRTTSPYFSPNSAIAPRATASLYDSS